MTWIELLGNAKQTLRGSYILVYRYNARDVQTSQEVFPPCLAQHECGDISLNLESPYLVRPHPCSGGVPRAGIVHAMGLEEVRHDL